MEKLYRLLLSVVLLSAALGCGKDEPVVEPVTDGVFSSEYKGRDHMVSYSLSKVIPEDTVKFIFKNLKSGEVVDRSSLVTYVKGEGLKFKMSEDLPYGDYLLAAVDYRLHPKLRKELVRRGVNVNISFSARGASLGKSRFDDDDEKNDSFLEGRGTEDDPYLISCGDDLKKVQLKTNREPYETFQGSYFLQTIDIDLGPSLDFTYGWIPVSSYPNFPFRGCYDGGGYEITGLRIVNEDANMHGLFGCAEGAVFQNINIIDPYINAGSFVGPLLGTVFTAGDAVYTTTVSDVNVTGPVVKGAGAVSSLVGSVDQYASLSIFNSRVEGSKVEGQYGVGGLVGAAVQHSVVVIDNTSHEGEISAVTGRTKDPVSLFGGIVGTCDSLVMTRTVNRGRIDVAAANSTGADNVGIGIGGMVGGCGPSQFIACENEADVTAHGSSDGVGGILGSSSAGKSGGDEGEFFNTIIFLGVGNKGRIEGGEDVGGIMGEGQAIIMEAYNEGAIQSGKNAGGIIAKAPSLILHAAVNTGDVSGNTHVGGMAGYTPFNQIFLCNNYGKISALGSTANLGGIAGTAGNNSAISYSGNYGYLENMRGRNDKNGNVGGIVGLLGEQREYSAGDIVSIVIGSVTIVAAGVDIGFAVGNVTAVAPLVLDICVNAVGLVSGLHFTHATYCHPYRINSDTFKVELRKRVEDVRFKMKGINSEAGESFKASVKDDYAFDADIVKALADSQLAEFEKLHETCFNDSYTGGENLPAADIRTAHDGILEEKESTRRDVEVWKDDMTMNTTITGWVCTGIAIAALVVGAVFTFGATGVAAAAAITTAALVVGVGAGAVGGASGIVAGVNNFTENTSIITQTYNFGNLNSSENVFAGGLVGEVGDFARIQNSYVMGNYVGEEHKSNPRQGIILGIDADRSGIYQCVGYSDRWFNSIVGKRGYNTVSEDCLYIGNEEGGVRKEMLLDPESYRKFGIDPAFWHIPEDKSGVLPYFTNSKYLVK